MNGERGTLRRAAMAVGTAGVALTPLEQDGLEAEVELAVDLLDGIDGVPEATKIAFLEAMVREICAEPLRVKMLAAFRLECAASDGEPVDGILGQALDGAMRALTPIARRRHPELVGVILDPDNDRGSEIMTTEELAAMLARRAAEAIAPIVLEWVRARESDD